MSYRTNLFNGGTGSDLTITGPGPLFQPSLGGNVVVSFGNPSVLTANMTLLADQSLIVPGVFTIGAYSVTCPSGATFTTI